MHGQLRIDEVYAFVCVDDDDTEGIPAMRIGDMGYPMVGADMARVEDLRPAAQQIADMGKKVTLVKFSVREEIEVFEPRS